MDTLLTVLSFVIAGVVLYFVQRVQGIEKDEIAVRVGLLSIFMAIAVIVGLIIVSILFAWWMPANIMKTIYSISPIIGAAILATILFYFFKRRQ